MARREALELDAFARRALRCADTVAPTLSGDLATLFAIDLAIPPAPGVATCAVGSAATCTGAGSGGAPATRRPSTFTTGCPGAWE